MGILRHECITSVPNNQILVARARMFASWLLLLHIYSRSPWSFMAQKVPDANEECRWILSRLGLSLPFFSSCSSSRTCQAAGVLMLISGSVCRLKPVRRCFCWTHSVLALVGTFCWLRSLVWWSLDLSVVDLCCFRRLHMALNIALTMEVLKFYVSSFVF